MESVVASRTRYGTKENRLFFFGLEKVCIFSNDPFYRDMTGFSLGLKCIGSEEEIEDDVET